MGTWLGLIIGNSRLHWAWFGGDQLRRTWNTVHFSEDAIATSLTLPHPPLPLPPDLDDHALRSVPLMVASVVPAQTQLWLNYPNVVELTLEQLELANLYPTLGIDRALAALGAFHHWDSSVLVIDGGTALTFTGVNEQGALVGGAIAPGLRLQIQTLHHHTAALPDVEMATLQAIEWWATNTPDAILSGVWHLVLAGVRDFIWNWQQNYPLSHIVLTGGDGELLYQALCGQWQPWHKRSLHLDPHIGLRGMAIASAQLLNSEKPG
ncbi:MAG: pantothenate kinase [Cyanothece sp. SIO2G6]|nr:pantothenate kinase [Cyanothece sp. SIO2G6]